MLALFVSEHCTMNSIDHLSEACCLMFQDSVLASKIKMHRTKSTNVIENVLALHFESLLCKDVGAQKFGVLIDESTDVSVIKVLGIVIRYFSFSESEVVSTFLTLQEYRSSML